MHQSGSGPFARTRKETRGSRYLGTPHPFTNQRGGKGWAQWEGTRTPSLVSCKPTARLCTSAPLDSVRCPRPLPAALSQSKTARSSPHLFSSLFSAYELSPLFRPVDCWFHRQSSPTRPFPAKDEARTPGGSCARNSLCRSNPHPGKPSRLLTAATPLVVLKPSTSSTFRDPPLYRTICESRPTTLTLSPSDLVFANPFPVVDSVRSLELLPPSLIIRSDGVQGPYRPSCPARRPSRLSLILLSPIPMTLADQRPHRSSQESTSWWSSEVVASVNRASPSN
jgi:hypothetical protein